MPPAMTEHFFRAAYVTNKLRTALGLGEHNQIRAERTAEYFNEILQSHETEFLPTHKSMTKRRRLVSPARIRRSTFQFCKTTTRTQDDIDPDYNNCKYRTPTQKA